MTDLTQQIHEAYARDQAARPLALTADDIPISYDAITDAWLTAILCGHVAGAAVTAHRLGEPDDGTNNRRRIYLDYNAAGRTAGLPRSVFCKATHGLPNRMILGHSGAVICEVTFYNAARGLLDIEAPRAYLAAYDPVSFNSIVVLEDLGEDVAFCTQRTAVDRRRVESQVGLLAAVHGRFSGAPELETSLAPLPLWHRRFANLERFHLKECCARGFLAAESVIPPNLFRRHAEIWPATVQSVERHRNLPVTLCHGDVHLKNWYVTGSGAMGLSDWGVAHRGHWARDLVYAITTALTVADRRAWERDLIRLHLDRMHTAGVPALSFDDAWTYYRQALPSVLAFWTMTLAPSADMPDMQPSETSLTFIERIAHAMDDTDALDAL